MKKYLHLILLISALFVTACGGDNKASAPATSTEVLPTPEMK